MAEERTAKKKKARRAAPAATDADTSLRLRSDPRSERRYEPKAGTLAVVSVLAMCIGAVLVGAGTYGQWFRSEALGPHKYGPHLLAAGAVILIGVAFTGMGAAKPVRVGDAGVALEKDAADLDRIPWYEVTRLVLGANALTIQASGHSIAIPLPAQAEAAARALDEAKKRIPTKVPDDLKLPAPQDSVGEIIPLDAPQVAGMRCKKSDKAIAFERDARLCGRCGEVYHKDSVPKRCLTCDAKLTA